MVQSGGPPGGAGEVARSDSRCPRRLVLLESGEDSPAAEVLIEYKGADINGTRLHADLRRLARERKGSYVAAEWLGPLGWTRFLWYCHEKEEIA